jgi:hypothetical protein
MSFLETTTDAIKVSQSPFGGQRDSAIATLNGGGSIVVWTDEGYSGGGGDGNNWGIKGRLIDPMGTPIGNEFVVNTVVAGRQDQSAVTALVGGGFVVTWLDNAPYGSPTNYAVKAQVYSAAGVRQGGELLVGSGRASDGEEVEPSIIALAGGGWTIAWIGRDPLVPLKQIVEGRTYGVVGTPDGTAWTVDRPAPIGGGHVYDTDVTLAANPNGGFIVAWLRVNYDLSYRIVDAGAFAQHRHADGSVYGTATTIAVDGPNVANGFYGPRFISIDATVTASGGILATWLADMGDGEFIRARGFDASGVALGGASTLGAVIGFPPPEAVDIDLLTDGTSVVSLNASAWRIDGSGALIGSELNIAPDIGYSDTADIAARSDGGFTVSWTGTRDRSDAILVQQYDFSPTPITDIRVNGIINEAAIGNMPLLRFTTDTRIVNGIVQYELVSDPRGLFRIDGDTLVLKIGGTLDYETRPTETIVIRAIDAAGNQVTETFVLAIQNAVNEGPAYNAGNIQTLASYAPSASVVSIAGLRDGEIGVAWNDGVDGFRSLAISNDEIAGIGFRYSGSEPAIAALTNGGYVVSSGLSNGFTSQFFAQSFDSAGQTVAPRTQVGFAGFTDISSDIAAFGGGYALAWEPNIFLGYGPYAYSPPIGSGFKNIDPALAELADGRLIVVWERNGGSYARFIAADRSLSGPEFSVSNRGATDPDVAALNQGGFVVAWDGDDPTNAIRFQLYNAAGVALGNLVEVDTGADGERDKVTITGLADGGFVVGWTVTNDLGVVALFARTFTADGTAAGARITIADSIEITGGRFAPELRLTALASDGFAAGWNQDDKVLIRRFELTTRPTAINDVVVTDEDVPLVIAPLLNDIDLAAAGLVLRSAKADTGHVAISANGIFTYTPNPGWYGNDVIRYSVASTLGGADFGEISVTVRSVNYAPTVQPIRLAATSGVGFDAAAIVAFTASDIDVSPEGMPDLLVLRSVANATGGTVSIIGGDIVVTGSAGMLGFDFTVTDATGASGTARATVALLDATNGANVLTVGAGTSFSRVFGLGGNDTISGAGGQDYLSGDAGNDGLDGGAGIDTLVGGAGDDTYVFDNEDIIIEQPGEGVDRIITALTVALPDEVEELVLGGGFENVDGYGNALDNLLVGNEYKNYLDGSDGNDTLIGDDGDDVLVGSTGIDRFIGGLGNDSFFIDSAAELIFEDYMGGHDVVYSDGDYYLFPNIEDLLLTSSAVDGFGVGNDLANIITGNDGSNLLIGGGGDDSIAGGAGIDALFGEAGNDSLNGGAGIDYLVGGVGNDTLNGDGDADALYGEDGNDLLIGGSDFQTDILVGGAGNDTLDGASGLGDYDLMDGGAGDDTYLVDTPDDLTFEAINGGVDTVRANINGAGYYLYANTENLILEGNTPFGVGNELANRLTGNAIGNYLLGGAGNDILNGKGGNDVLFGEGGADTFVFERGTGGDVIGDFQPGTDKIQLSGLGFTSFAQLRANFIENAGTTAINLGNGDFVVINGIANAQLGAADFVLG